MPNFLIFGLPFVSRDALGETDSSTNLRDSGERGMYRNVRQLTSRVLLFAILDLFHPLPTDSECFILRCRLRGEEDGYAP